MTRSTVRLVCAVIMLLAGLPVPSPRAEPPPTFTLDQTVLPRGISGQADDPVPVIVTYELKKARAVDRTIARNPKAFWVRQIVARIEASKLDPPQELKDAAALQLSFVVGRDGRLISKSVSKSSGSAVADRTAIAMLERAQPFPPMPDAMSDSELTFNLPIRFR